MSVTRYKKAVRFTARIRLRWLCLLERLLAKRRLDDLCLILGGHIFFQTLSTAVELHLFDLLSKHGRLTREAICDELAIEMKPCRILLLGCVALGLVRKKGPYYSNAQLTDRLLVSTQPGNIVSIVRWQNHINYRPLGHFLEAVKANRNVGLDDFDGKEETLYERLAHVPRLEQIFQEAMESISVQANRQLGRFVDFSVFDRVLDVGGGNGSNLISLVERCPGLHGTVFDSPSVCEIAQQNFKARGLDGVLSACAGNCFDDHFPDDCDCILFCHFFTIWSAERNQRLLQKAYAALPSGGAAMIFNMMQRDDETGPLTAALGSPYFLALATGEGMLYTWHEYTTWFEQAGFKNITTLSLPRDHGVIIGHKP